MNFHFVIFLLISINKWLIWSDSRFSTEKNAKVTKQGFFALKIIGFP